MITVVCLWMSRLKAHSLRIVRRINKTQWIVRIRLHYFLKKVWICNLTLTSVDRLQELLSQAQTCLRLLRDSNLHSKSKEFRPSRWVLEVTLDRVQQVWDSDMLRAWCPKWRVTTSSSPRTQVLFLCKRRAQVSSTRRVMRIEAWQEELLTIVFRTWSSDKIEVTLIKTLTRVDRSRCPICKFKALTRASCQE